MTAVLHTDPIAIQNALAALGLEEQPLLDAAMHGYLARSNCTANHPPLFPSFVAWGETVRVLRERLAPMGWIRSDEKNYSRTLHPDGHIAIAVATGNEATGLASDSPCTTSVKGPSTIEAVEANCSQAWLPGMEPAETLADEDESQVTTWLLLIHHAQNEIRSELSQPVAIGPDGRINGWRERILLKTMPLDPEPLAITPPPQPDLDIEIRRKA
jgi:hypothetical protein